MIIYKITNRVNGKVYIGQTTRPLHIRWGLHCCQSGCSALRNAIQKYGKDNFTVEQIDVACDLDELDKKEIYWIEFYDSMNRDRGYNLQSGGHRNRFVSKETRLKISKGNKGKVVSSITRKKLSDALKKYLENESARRIRSECKLGAKHPQARKVRCVETGEVFDCIVNAAKANGINSPSDITSCCKGRHKTAGKLHWEYANV